MAHLIYAVSQGDGFVEITGEVGTGKTTLCRTLLENLDKFTEAAYIFNPELNPLQLLKAINDEFGLSSEGNSIKALSDILNDFLIEKKAEGKRVLLIIDEAQNLQRDVLEQLRLLSNLETTTSKLMQIILVGQPELGDMLDSPGLRQLGQRIALRCRLSPLSFRETQRYIQHRIEVASRKQPQVNFARGACRAVYKYSGGIPRLINIGCDRILLTAFGLNRKKVTNIIAKTSLSELAGKRDSRRASPSEKRKMSFNYAIFLGVFVAVLYLAAIFLFVHRSVDMRMATYLESGNGERPMVTQRVEKMQEKEVKESLAPISEAGAAQVHREDRTRPEEIMEGQSLMPPAGSPADILSFLNKRFSRSDALKAVLSLWIIKPEISALLQDLKDDETFFRIAARQNGLQILRIWNDPDLLRKLNLPAVLEFRLPGNNTSRYLALLKLDGERSVISDGEGGNMAWTFSEIMPYWSGLAHVPWRNFLGDDTIIPHGSTGESVLSLKSLLLDLGFKGLDLGPVYDEKTVTAIKGIQAKHGLDTDGIVGPLTRIALYNEQGFLTIPHLGGE
ncbi:MAG: AAA family ATPase [Deltaproteobacteria bacterium]|nr:AAA family ATPase [Deltaproteobacteria bacterium]